MKENNSLKKNLFSRKQFLKTVGLSTAVAAGLSSCTEVTGVMEEGNHPPLEIGPDPRPNNGRIWIGSGDLALLNTIHIYTRLEAAFYEQVLENPYSGITQKEEAILTALKNHEVAHCDFLSAFLKQNAVESIHFNFEYFDFTNKTNILDAGFRFENIGVSMYNHFPELLKRPKLYSIFTKIGSVEARHAASVQFLLPSRSFSGREPIDENGLDTYNAPRKAWSLFFRYIVEGFDLQGLPRVQADIDLF